MTIVTAIIVMTTGTRTARAAPIATTIIEPLTRASHFPTRIEATEGRRRPMPAPLQQASSGSSTARASVTAPTMVATMPSARFSLSPANVCAIRDASLCTYCVRRSRTSGAACRASPASAHNAQPLPGFLMCFSLRNISPNARNGSFFADPFEFAAAIEAAIRFSLCATAYSSASTINASRDSKWP
jgi:hypothetical protein